MAVNSQSEIAMSIGKAGAKIHRPISSQTWGKPSGVQIILAWFPSSYKFLFMPMTLLRSSGFFRTHFFWEKTHFNELKKNRIYTPFFYIMWKIMLGQVNSRDGPNTPISVRARTLEHCEPHNKPYWSLWDPNNQKCPFLGLRCKLFVI